MDQRHDESGGRIIGEACHFVDLASFFTGRTRSRSAGADGSSPDDVTMTLRYPGGSVATIVYTTVGASDWPRSISKCTPAA